jgi:hypothetical protein
VQRDVVRRQRLELLLQRVGRLAGDEQFPLRIAGAAADMAIGLGQVLVLVAHQLGGHAGLLARRLPGLVVLLVLEFARWMRRRIPAGHLVDRLGHGGVVERLRAVSAQCKTRDPRPRP